MDFLKDEQICLMWHHKDMVRRKQIASEKKICFAITIPLLQSIYNFCFNLFCTFYDVRVKSPGFDAYELFRATHSHNSTQYSHIVGL